MLKSKENRGITLVALVITIIILLILAGITISQLTNSGLFNNVNTAKEKYTFAEAQEQLKLKISELQMERYADSGTYPTLSELKDYLEDSKFEGEYEVELLYEPLAATNTSTVPLYAKVTHVPTKFVFYVDGKLVVLGGQSSNEVKENEKIKQATIQLSGTTSNVENSINATVTHNKGTSEIDVSSCKYVYNTNSGKIGLSADNYTGGTFTDNGQVISLNATKTGTYYLHVLSIDQDGNKIETISQAIEVEAVLGYVNKPNVTGIPAFTYVTWDNNTINDTQTVEPSNWYDYDNGQWANIKVAQNGLTAYWVWIPKFEYIVPTSSSATQIQIKFIRKDQTTPDTGYTIHPAFQFDGKNLGGIWVSKFEASSSSPSTSYGGGDSGSLYVQSKPNEISWRYITPQNAFNVCRNMTQANNVLSGSNKINSHLIKNTEWGAIALLSQSAAGVYNRNSATGATANGGDGTYIVWSNPYYTGSGETLTLKTGYTSNASNGYNDKSITTVDAYNTGNGPKGSTTGTVYGVYDMSGGAWEYVAAVFKNSENAKFGLSSSSDIAKYLNVYENSTNENTNFNGAITGDATKETATWNSDFATFCNSNSPAVIRGYSYKGGASSGVFAFSESSGSTHGATGFRPVMINE